MVHVDMENSPATIRMDSKQDIFYLKPDSILDFANIHLVSLEGDTFLMDKTVLAANSKLFCSLLLDQEDCNEKVVFNTQIIKEHLADFCQFAATGTLPESSWGTDLVSSFRNLGVDLESSWIKLETVTVESVAGLQRFVPKTANKSLLDVVIKKEEVSVTSESIPQSLPKARKRTNSDANLNNYDYFDQEWGGDDYDEDYVPTVEKSDQVPPIKSDVSDNEEKPLAKKMKVGGKKKKVKKEGGENVRKKPVKKLGSRKPLKDEKKDDGSLGFWFCEWCEDQKNLHTEINLTYHKILHHPDMAEQCDRCKGMILLSDRKSVKLHEKCKKTHQCVCCGIRKREILKMEQHWRDRGEAHARVPYPCPLCPPGTEFTSHLEHNRHCSEVHDGVVAQPCSMCDEVFGDRWMVLDHLRVDHAEEGDTTKIHLADKKRDLWKQFQCPKCSLGYSTQEALEAHEARHEYKVSNTQPHTSWHCSICQEPCNNRAELQAHTNQMHPDQPVSCHICNRQFTSYQKLGKLRHHMRIVHENPPKPKVETTVCVCCGELFEKRRKYAEHLKKFGKFHNNRCAYKECQELPGFETWPEHELHVKKAHDGAFVSRCKWCPEYFETDYLMRQHMKKFHADMRSTINKPREMCVHCGKIMLKAAMKDHFDREHGNTEHVCDVCQKVFYSKYQLTAHKKSHEKINPCPHCGKHDLSVQALRQHILLNHTPDHQKPLKCPYCPKGFTSRDNLNHHVNTHTGEKPYKCHICNAAFAHPANQKAHIRAHEGIKRKK